MKITFRYDKEYQTFEGFGASGAWWAQEVGGWDHIDPLSGRPVRDRISQLLYDKTEGIGLRTYRYNLGAGSKESGKGKFQNPLRRAECFETAPGVYDFNKDKNAVYLLRQAVKDGADEVVFFVNSPLERLTKNGLAHCSKAFRDNLPKESDKAFAAYVLDVTEHFVGEGLPIRYISPINEPLWKWTGAQEGCHYSPRSAARVMKVFADEMAKRPALDGVRLSGLENGDIRWFNRSYTRALMRFKSVRERIDSVDVHSYFLNPVDLPFLRRTDYLKRYRRWLNRRYPGLAVKMSEWTHMQGGRDKGMDSALVMAKTMFEDISLLNVTSWQHWIAVSEVDYCDGLIYINLDDKTFEMTKRYYATGNFSKYIPCGAVRFDVRPDDKDVMALGFQKDSRITLILINETDEPKEWQAPENAVQIVTSETDELARQPIENGKAIIKPKSVNTFIFERESI
ncbi:MAG: xylanase [Clostridia bacterium]|nr:xylanase [Clostridia bacterium]